MNALSKPSTLFAASINNEEIKAIQTPGTQLGGQHALSTATFAVPPSRSAHRHEMVSHEGHQRSLRGIVAASAVAAVVWMVW